MRKKPIYITGVSGNGATTGEVWSRFDRTYKANPFPKVGEDAYEIRFWVGTSGKTVNPEKSIHVGYRTETPAESVGYTTVALPAAEYAVFDVYVAQGYDSGNAEMEQWISDHADVYRVMEYDGYGYAIECYTDRFKGGTAPDSIVEMWIPLHRICASCTMPMTKPEDFSDNQKNHTKKRYSHIKELYEKIAYIKNSFIQNPAEDKKKNIRIRYFSTAACVLVLLGAGLIWQFNKGPKPSIDTEPEKFSNSSLIKKVELIYRNAAYEKVYMPYYKFFVELPSMKPIDKLKDFNAYGVYYVPAVDGQYIENMPVWDGNLH